MELPCIAGTCDDDKPQRMCIDVYWCVDFSPLLHCIVIYYQSETHMNDVRSDSIENAVETGAFDQLANAKAKKKKKQKKKEAETITTGKHLSLRERGLQLQYWHFFF
jgi:hypothetical protein